LEELLEERYVVNPGTVDAAFEKTSGHEPACVHVRSEVLMPAATCPSKRRSLFPGLGGFVDLIRQPK
jgi:hypothetical protein